MRRFLIALVATTTMTAAGVAYGFWWFPFVSGLVVGMLIRRNRVGLPTGALAGALAWGLLLALDAARFGAGSAATSLAEIMGFGNNALLPVALTCVIGLLLGLTGAWLGAALRAFFEPRNKPDVAPNARVDAGQGR
jgi:hypothetical protein